MNSSLTTNDNQFEEKLKNHVYKKAWQLYYHHYTAPSADSYQSQLQHGGSFKNAYEFCKIAYHGLNSPPLLKTLYYWETTLILYLMSDNILPVWEDKRNSKFFTIKFSINFPTELPDNFDQNLIDVLKEPKNINYYKVHFARELIDHVIENGKKFKDGTMIESQFNDIFDNFDIYGLTIRYSKDQFNATFWLKKLPDQSFIDAIQTDLPFLAKSMNPQIEITSIEKKLTEQKQKEEEISKRHKTIQSLSSRKRNIATTQQQPKGGGSSSSFSVNSQKQIVFKKPTGPFRPSIKK